MNFSFSSLVVT
eukprot:UN07163